MFYEREVLEKAVAELFNHRLKVKLKDKLGIEWGGKDAEGWIIPFARRRLIMIALEDDLYMDLPSYFASGGSVGLVLESLFYISEDLEPEYLTLFQSFNRKPIREDKMTWLKKKRIVDLPAQDGYFYVYAVSRFDFREVLRDRKEDDTLFYPDHLVAKPEPKLGLRYAMVDLVFMP